MGIRVFSSCLAEEEERGVKSEDWKEERGSLRSLMGVEKEKKKRGGSSCPYPKGPSFDELHLCGGRRHGIRKERRTFSTSS